MWPIEMWLVDDGAVGNLPGISHVAFSQKSSNQLFPAVLLRYWSRVESRTGNNVDLVFFPLTCRRGFPAGRDPEGILKTIIPFEKDWKRFFKSKCGLESQMQLHKGFWPHSVH